MDTAVLSVPLYIADGLWQQIVATLTFFFGYLQQDELDKTAHFISVLLILFTLYTCTTAAQNLVATALSGPMLRVRSMLMWLVQLLQFIVAFVLGVLVRMLTDPLIKGPHAGSFDAVQLLFLFSVAIIFIILLSLLRFMSEGCKEDLMLIQGYEMQLLQQQQQRQVRTVTPELVGLLSDCFSLV